MSYPMLEDVLQRRPYNAVSDFVDGNVARFINHACKPNCWIEIDGKTIWVRAARTIRKGEELTYDYNTEGDKVIPCRCRPGCKTKL